MRWSIGILFACALALPGAEAEASLADAVKDKDTAAIARLLKERADVNAPQVDGTTALHWAAYRDDLETAKLLIRAGANAKAANRYGVTPLSLACTNGSGPMVELLLDAGADPNTTLPGGESVLMVAARTGKVAPVKLLLARGADVHAKEGHEQTALMWAAAEGNTEVVNTLIEFGANFRDRLPSGFTPLLFAVRNGHLDTVRALIQAGADPNDTIPRNSGRRGSQGRGVPRAGTTALILATTNGHFELAAYLLDAGADPNAIGPGYTALHILTTVRKPGGGDNDPAPRGSGSMTSLEFVKKMVEHGANLNARMTRRVGIGLTSLNTVGATPYLLAARSADAELMRELVKLGADPNIPNADNANAVIVAAGLGTRSPGEDAGTEEEVLEAVQVALDHGVDINAVDDNGETAMHGAAYKNLPAVVELLAAKGADISIWNRRNKHGWTPLTIAEGYRFGNYKPSPVTVAAFHKVMAAAGVTIPPPYKPEDAGKNSDYAKP